MVIRKSIETRAENPIGLAQDVASEMVSELDRHVSSLFVLYHQYQKHHWVVEGPQFRDLHKFFEDKYNEVHDSVDLLAERITALGGTPTSGPAALSDLSYVRHEQEGVCGLRDMLELDRAHERDIAIKLRGSIRMALDSGDYGTEHLLKEVLAKCEHRCHELDTFLGNDSLERGFER